MEKNCSDKKVAGLHEVDGLYEYNEVFCFLDEIKGFIKELEYRAYEERKTDPEVATEDNLEFCAFKKDPSPMFIGMIQLVKQLISRNLDEAYCLVNRRRNNFFIYPNREAFIPDIDEDGNLL